jgi:hypothetical protein
MTAGQRLLRFPPIEIDFSELVSDAIARSDFDNATPGSR